MMITRSLCHALAGVGLLLALAEPAGGEAINWETSYRDAKKLAKESGRLMMIDFWADW